MSFAKKSSPLETLYRRAARGMCMDLRAMQEACARFGHPEQKIRVVHVAGTNGKGSVCAMVEAMARTHGLSTGLYTSPHLCRFAERIALNGASIQENVLDALLEEVLPQTPNLSFFETATLAALLAFERARVDLAVLEVGLGGRLDATNVVPKPLVCALTRIALDHTAQLGSTLEAIAREKAGIAKPGVELLLGSVSPSVRHAIEEVTHARGATCSLVYDREEVREFVAQGGGIGLMGPHQVENAALAYGVGRHLGIPPLPCTEGIANTRWPGRCEQLSRDGITYLLDAAHNPDGAEALARTLHTLASPPGPRALVFGALADKDWPRMLDLLAPLADTRVYIAPPISSNRPPASLEAMCARHPGQVASSIPEALTYGEGSPLVVVAGSIHLLGAVRAHLLGLPSDPHVTL